MIKFVSILTGVLSLNFMVSYTSPWGTQPENVLVEFSKSAIGIESGQPVFTRDTKILVSNPKAEKVKIFINEDEKELKESKIELSNLEEGTYTMIIVSADENKQNDEQTIGFTIQ